MGGPLQQVNDNGIGSSKTFALYELLHMVFPVKKSIDYI